MNSLEALEKLCDMATPDGDCLNYVIGLVATIKQNLELKEQLEKENNELKDQLSYLKEELEGYQSLYEWSQSKNSILKLENNELKELKNDIELNEAQIDDLTLEVANYKHALEEKNEIIMDLKEDLRLTTIERTNCEDIWEEEHQKCCDLEKENQELKKEKNATVLLMKLMNLDGNIVESALVLEKYKKTIEILKKFNFKLGQYGNGEYYILIYYAGITIEIILTQEEFEILKEVLSNE